MEDENLKLTTGERWIVVIALALGGLGIALVVLLFSASGGDLKLNSMLYSSKSGAPRLFLTYIEENCSGEEGCSLSGYVVRVINPKDGKVLSEARRAYYEDSSYPSVYLECTKNALWLIQGHSPSGNGFATKFPLNNAGQLSEGIDNPVLQDAIINNPTGYQTLSVANRYNELACFDLNTEQLSQAACTTANINPNENRFFEVKREPNAALTKIYYWKGEFPNTHTAPSITILDPNDKSKASGRSQDSYTEPPITSYLQTGTLTEAQMNDYKRQAPAQYSQVQPVFTRDYLLYPTALYQDEQLIVYKAKKDISQKQDPQDELIAISRTGQVYWRMDSPFKTSFVVYSCAVENNQTIILGVPSGAVCIDNNTGQQVWLCTFD